MRLDTFETALWMPTFALSLWSLRYGVEESELVKAACRSFMALLVRKKILIVNLHYSHS